MSQSNANIIQTLFHVKNGNFMEDKIMQMAKLFSLTTGQLKHDKVSQLFFSCANKTPQ